jgi:hypothetical protein
VFEGSVWFHHRWPPRRTTSYVSKKGESFETLRAARPSNATTQPLKKGGIKFTKQDSANVGFAKPLWDKPKLTRAVHRWLRDGIRRSNDSLAHCEHVSASENIPPDRSNTACGKTTNDCGRVRKLERTPLPNPIVGAYFAVESVMRHKR